jgi:hypothetical protein
MSSTVDAAGVTFDVGLAGSAGSGAGANNDGVAGVAENLHGVS